jgi:hypothetical protein
VSAPPSQPNTALEALGKTLGVLVALVTTLPIYEQVYPLFQRYALSYVTYKTRDYIPFFELTFMACLFVAIVVVVWFSIAMTIKLLKGFVLGFFFLISTTFRR